MTSAVAPQLARVPSRRARGADEDILPTIGVGEIFAASSRLEPTIPVIDACVGRPTPAYGQPAGGKSITLLPASVASAAGLPILGAPALPPMRVLWLDAEVGGPLTCSRLQRIARARGVGPSYIGDRLRLAIYPAFALDDPSAERVLTATCAGYTLAILDSLTALSGDADETSPEMGRLLLMLARVSGRTGCAIVVVHHSRRDGEIRGSTSIAAGSECTWQVRARGRATVMRQQRSPIGALRDDVVLRIRDVEIDGDPLAGLAVDLVGAAAVSTASIDDQVIEYLTGQGPYVGGAQSLAEAMGHGAAHRDAIRRLIVDGQIVRTGGSTSSPMLTEALGSVTLGGVGSLGLGKASVGSTIVRPQLSCFFLPGDNASLLRRVLPITLRP